MSIENVNNFSYNKVDISQQETYVKKGNKEYYSKSTSVSAESLSVEAGAVYEPSNEQKVLTDNGYQVDMEKVHAMKAESEQRMVDLFRQTVKEGFGKQFRGLKRFLEFAQEKLGDEFPVSRPEGKNGTANYTISIDVSVDVVIGKLDESSEADEVNPVQADVEDDGYWGAEATSQRFLEFAQALSGGDPSKGRMLLDAVEEGFKAAMDILGFSEEDDSIPSLSLRTLELTREKFEAWIEGDEEDDDDVYTEDVTNTFVNQINNVDDD